MTELRLSRSSGIPVGFTDWVSALRDDGEIRQKFEAVLRNPKHPQYGFCLKLMLAYAEGTPIKRIQAVVVSPQQQETGEEVAERVWQRVTQLARVAPNDRRLQVLSSIQGAEAKLNAAEPAEVVP